MRHLPPVYSPVGPRALLAGALARGRRQRVLAAVRRRIEQTCAPAAVRLTDSGTSALRLALESAGRTDRLPVAMPAYGCYDLVTAARGANGDVVYYDVDPETLGPNPASLERAVRAGARSVVIAYLFGVPVDLDALRPVWEGGRVLFIEDAAQAVGATLAGRPLGSFGDLSILSFARGKGRTGGGGGALLAGSDAGAALLSTTTSSEQGSGARGGLVRAAAQWALTRPSLYWLPRTVPALHLGETRYREPRPVAGMSATAAAILDATWDEADRETEVRRAVGRAYTAALEGVAGVRLVAVPPGSLAGHLRFPVLIDGSLRDARAARAARLGLAAGYPGILPDVRPSPRDRTADDLPGARFLARGLWTLPTHRFVTRRDVERIVAFLRETG